MKIELITRSKKISTFFPAPNFLLHNSLCNSGYLYLVIDFFCLSRIYFWMQKNILSCNFVKLVRSSCWSRKFLLRVPSRNFLTLISEKPP